MFCEKCGNRIESGQRFCSLCGTNVQAVAAGADRSVLKVSNSAMSEDQVKRKKKKTILFSVVAVVIVLVLGFGIGAIRNGLETSDLKKALNSKNVGQVNAVYAQARPDNAKLEKYDALIKKTIQKITEDIDKHDFEEEAEKTGSEALTQYLQSEWGTLVTGNSDTGKNLSNSVSVYNQLDWKALENLVRSRRSYCEGIYCYKAEKDYDEAAVLFLEMDVTDSKYEEGLRYAETCVDLHIQEVATEAEKRIAEDDVAGAISILEDVQYDFGNIGKSSEKIHEKIIQAIRTSADAYMNKADEYFNAGDFQAAIGHAEAAIAINPNENYEVKLEEYKRYLPLKMYLSENVLAADGLYKENSLLSVDRKQYDNCIVYSWWVGASPKSANYYLGGNYDTVNGVFFTTAESAKYQFDGYAYIEAYGDGKLIYTSPSMKCESVPANIEFSVTGVQKLEIRFVGKDSTAANVYCPEVALSELTAHKNPPQ